jgi:hypothetical protein
MRLFGFGGDHNVCAFTRCAFGDREADASAGAGNEERFSAKIQFPLPGVFTCACRRVRAMKSLTKNLQICQWLIQCA